MILPELTYSPVLQRSSSDIFAIQGVLQDMEQF
jgi:hypothetical protein